MQRTKTTKRQRMGLLAIGGVALIAVAAFAAQPVYFAWINPCVGLLTFYEGIGYVCEADWDDPAVWDTGDPDTYPLHGYDHPTIEKSNTGIARIRPPLKQKLVPVARRCVGNNSGK